MDKIGRANVQAGENGLAANLHTRFLDTDLHRLTRILRKIENGVSLFGPCPKALNLRFVTIHSICLI